MQNSSNRLPNKGVSASRLHLIIWEFVNTQKHALRVRRRQEHFIYGLFNNAVITEGFIVLNEEVVNIWKEVVAQSRSQTDICLEGMGKITKHLSLQLVICIGYEEGTRKCGHAKAQAVTGFLPGMLGFKLGPIHVGFMVDRVTLRQVFSEQDGCTLSVSFHQCSIFVTNAT